MNDWIHVHHLILVAVWTDCNVMSIITITTTTTTTTTTQLLNSLLLLIPCYMTSDYNRQSETTTNATTLQWQWFHTSTLQTCQTSPLRSFAPSLRLHHLSAEVKEWEMHQANNNTLEYESYNNYKLSIHDIV